MLTAYLTTAAVFLLADALWLRLVMRPVFERDAGHLLAEKPDLAVAAGFYVLYCAGVVYFVVWPAVLAESLRAAALNGAALGALAYGCYEATNKATLRGWSWRMLAIDLSWGAALTAVAAMAGTWAALAQP